MLGIGAADYPCKPVPAPGRQQAGVDRDVPPCLNEAARRWDSNRRWQISGRPLGVAWEDRWDFFIAYASSDRAAAESLYDLLSPPFRVFLDRRSLLPGEDWNSRISAAHNQTAVTLVLISSGTDSAYYQQEEIAAAIDLSRHAGSPHQVVPIFLDGLAEDSRLPYGLRLKQGISVPEAGSMAQVAQRLKTTLQQGLAMSAVEIQSRYQARAPVDQAVRLVPREDLDRNGLLGLASRKYVFVGDYDEQRHRALRQILSNLWIGDAFERVANSSVGWQALIFELGELNRRKMDLMPATWKAAFRILSDPRRAASFAATDEELARLGRPPRDYYSDDQSSWYSSCTTSERRHTPLGVDYFLNEVLGISWLCFNGRGITEGAPSGKSDGIPSRVFFVRNLPLSSITYRVEDLGTPDDNIVLN